jgi:tetratricopeptide (TPR) repeat protein
MYTLLSAIGLALFAILVPQVFGLSAVWTVLPGIAVGIAAFFWMSRRVGRRVQAVTEAADQELAALQQAVQRPGPGAEANVQRRIDKAVEILGRGFAFEKWQFGVGTMLNARIGMLLFSRSLILPKANVGDAIPYLEKSRIKGRKAQIFQGLWPAWAMLAVAYYRAKKDLDAASAVLEDAVSVAKKESLLWNLYAWILWKEERLDQAIAVLARGKEHLPDDAKLAENLQALQNRKKMKMRAFGEQWYQFGLERPKVAGMQPQMGHPRMRSTGLRRR